MKAIVCSPDGDNNDFDIVAGVLQGDTLAPYLFMTCLDYVLQISRDIIKENGFTPSIVLQKYISSVQILNAVLMRIYQE